MASEYDKNQMVGHIAQGDHAYVQREKSKHDPGSSHGFPIFARVVILDVISDPSVIDDTKLSYWEHELKVSNIKYASVAPRNSIIGRRIMGNGTGASEKTMVFYPFLPPHISLPSKPGEHVWVLIENPDAKVNELGYWICRIVDPHFIEDVNHTHSNRQFDKSFQPGTIAQAEGTDTPKYEFPNGVVDEQDGSRYIIGDTATIPGAEKSYEDLLTKSDASKQIQYEPIPRYKKRPGDTAFEGTNNTLIVLGTDRTAQIADYDSDQNKGKTPKSPADDLNGPGAGSIDIVAGRGQTKDTAGKSAQNSVGNKELGKSKKELSDKEGDPDLSNDRSRVLISQRTKPDKNFKLVKAVTKLTSKGAVKDEDNGSGAIVIKTDKIRFIARQDLIIMVTGATSKDENGNVKDVDADPDNCASVILRTNGDVIFTPAKKGILKLGGDDADLAVLCTRVNNQGAGGTVTASPIVDTMAGTQGGADGVNGVFSTKVLLK